MSKAVLISIRKEHNDKIFAGKKKWEGRKTCPGNVEIKNYIDPTRPYSKSDDDVKFFVYEPKTGGGCGKVVGEFICDFAQSFRHGVTKEICEALVVSKEFARSYFNKGKGYMIRVNEPKRYDQPKELSEFIRPSNGCCNEGKCNGCRFLEIGIDGVIEDDCNAEFDTDSYSILRRPPQSWCYVEEI